MTIAEGRIRTLKRKQQEAMPLFGAKLHGRGIKLLFTKSGVFWGRPGDWLLWSSSDHKWIVEGVMFDNLYEVVDHDGD